MKTSRLGTLALVAGLALAAAPALADPAPPDRGDRIERRLDRRGDRSEDRLDRRGDRIDQRLDRRGDRIDRRTDRRHGG